MQWVRARTDNNLVRTLPASEAARSQLKVFISYSRKDSRFVGELIAGLNYDGNFSVLLDQRSIAEGEPWRARIVELIKQCDALVVILSEHWLGSDVGNWEVGLAWDNSKRVVPVLASSLGSQHPPDRIAAINFVRFDQEPTQPPRLFMDGMSALRRALIEDLAWIREHGRLYTKATDWEADQKPPHRLLLGSDIGDAKSWLESWQPGSPAPAPIQREYIFESEKAEALRSSAERKRAELLRKALLISIVFGVFATIATVAAFLLKLSADAERASAQESESKHLTDLARTAMKGGEFTAAMTLAMSGLPKSGFASGWYDPRADRPFVPELASALYESYLRNHERRVLYAGSEPNPSSYSGSPIAANPQNDLVAFSDLKGNISLWDRVSGQRVNSFSEPEPDPGFIQFTSDGGRLLSPAHDGMVQLRDAGSQQATKTFGVAGTPTLAAAVSGNGALAVTGHDDHTVRFWNTASGQEMLPSLTLTGDARSLAVNADGTLIVIGTGDGEYGAWAAKLGSPATSLWNRHDAASIKSVAVSPNSKIVAFVTEDGRIIICDAGSGDTCKPLETTLVVSSLAFGPSGRFLYCLSNTGAVALYDLGEKRVVKALTTYPGVKSFAVSKDERELITNSPGEGVTVWNLDDVPGALEFFHREDSVPLTQISQDVKGELLAVAGADGRIDVLEARAQGKTSSLQSEPGSIIAVSGDGGKVGAATPDGRIRVWSVKTGTALSDFTTGHDIRFLTFDAVGVRVFFGGQDNDSRNTGYVSDAANGAPIAELDKSQIPGRLNAGAFDGSGQRLVTAGSTSSRFWNAQSGKLVDKKILPASEGELLRQALSPDGRWLATASEENVIEVRAMDTDKTTRFDQLSSRAVALQFSPDSSKLAAGTATGEVLVWDVKTARRLVSLPAGKGPIRGVAVDHDRVIFGAGNGIEAVPLFGSFAQLRDAATKALVRCPSATMLQLYHLSAPPAGCSANGQKQGAPH